MKRLLLLIISAFTIANAYSQQESFGAFIKPVDYEIQLSGNFSEPRATHFHSGLDIRTYADGKKLYALADGFVSRVSVSPYGYGLAIYIDYDNGYRSVYGHLSAFAGEIASYVKNIQYEKESFRIDVNLSPLDIPVKKGQVVAYSGNTGSSGGPHLHFEIRDASNDVSLNTLGQYIKINDVTPPEAKSIVIYPQSPKSSVAGKTTKQMLPLTKISSSTYKLTNQALAKGRIGIGIEYCDRITNSTNRFGARKVDMYVNDKIVYTSTFDKVDFDKQAYKNSCFDMNYYVNDSKYVQKLFVEPNNHLDLYSNLTNNGYFNIGDKDSARIKIILTDYNGNSSKVNFTILSDTAKNVKFSNSKKLKWNEKHTLQTAGCKAAIDSATLFDDMAITLTKTGSKKYSDVYSLGDETEATRNFTIFLSDSLVPDQLKSKVFICREIKGKTNYLDSKHSNGWYSAQTNRFGKFYILADTVAPRIQPTVISKDMTGRKYIEFKITDNLSGINTYSIYINGKWVLGEYEPKKTALRYYFDDNRLPKASTYKLKVVVGDNMKNEAVYEYEFTRN